MAPPRIQKAEGRSALVIKRGGGPYSAHLLLESSLLSESWGGVRRGAPKAPSGAKRHLGGAKRRPDRPRPLRAEGAIGELAGRVPMARSSRHTDIPRMAKAN